MIKKCTRCKAHDNKYNINCIPFSGNPDAEVLFLGEMAGKAEAEESKCKPAHFIGKAGEKFDQLLKYASLKREEIAIVNSLRCYKANNETPTQREMDACFFHTLMDVQRINPKLVLSMGGSALYQATGREGVEKYRGKLIWSDKINCKVFVVNHPAACLYDPKKWKTLVNDFKSIPNLINAELTKVKNYDYEFIETVDQFDKVFEELKGLPLCFDLETTGLDPYTNEITELQLAYDPSLIYVVDGDLLFNIKVKERLRILFDTSPVTGQGFEFDAKFLAIHLGIFPKLWDFDTCQAEYIITGMKDNDLSFLVGKYAPESLGYDEEVKALGGAHKVSDKNKRRQYGATDVGVLFKIAKKQKRQLYKQNRIDLYERLKLPTNRILTKMSLRGVQYDIDRLWKVDKDYEKKASKLLNKIKDLESVKACESHFGRRFNPRSSQMVHWLLLEYYELPVIQRVKKGKSEGNPSIGKDEMKRYAEKYKNPYCKTMELYRSFRNIRNNNLSGVVPKLVDGVAHTTYSLHSTNSGRPNSKDPNLLNIPRLKDIKQCIVAREGYKFICADLRQIEVRVAAVIYDDSNLIEVCNSVGSDFHCMIAAKANDIPYSEFYSKYKDGDEDIAKKRQDGKALTFGVLYQEGAEALAYNLGTSKEKAQEFIEEYFRGFPELKKNIEKQKQFVIKNGYVDTYFGFRRWFKDHQKEDHETLRMAVNTPIQGTAWNLLELILIEIDRVLEERGLKSALVLQVYDSVIVETHESEIEEVALLIKEVMENVNKPYPKLNRVKIEIDMEIGGNLADLKPLE